MSFFLAILGVMIVILLPSFLYTTHKTKEHLILLGAQNSLLEERIITLESTNPDELRIDFIAFADSVIASFQSSTLTMAERVVFARSLWDACKEFGLLEYRYTMLALAEVESSYQKNAVSHMGARGICQILPSTFMFVANTLHEPRDWRKDIFSLQLQARYSTFYLKMLLEDTNYDLEIALARYNFGHINTSTPYSRKVLSISENLSNLTLNQLGD